MVSKVKVFRWITLLFGSQCRVFKASRLPVGCSGFFLFDACLNCSRVCRIYFCLPLPLYLGHLLHVDILPSPSGSSPSSLSRNCLFHGSFCRVVLFHSFYLAKASDSHFSDFFKDVTHSQLSFYIVTSYFLLEGNP